MCAPTSVTATCAVCVCERESCVTVIVVFDGPPGVAESSDGTAASHFSSADGVHVFQYHVHVCISGSSHADVPSRFTPKLPFYKT